MSSESERDSSHLPRQAALRAVGWVAPLWRGEVLSRPVVLAAILAAVPRGVCFAAAAVLLPITLEALDFRSTQADLIWYPLTIVALVLAPAGTPTLAQ